MIVPVSEMREFFDPLTDVEYDAIDSIHNSVEQFVKSYCKRTFESTSYSLEKYDGNGDEFLFLDNFPITAIDRVAIRTIDVIRVMNSNDDSNASVSVNSTGLRLVYNGTADTSVTFAANVTMTAIVSAINAVGSGWQAEILSSIYANFKSTELIKKWGMNAIDSNWVYLSMPDDALDSFDVNENAGYIRRFSGWPSGFNNIYVSYEAGYSATNMPKDLKEAIKQFVSYLYNRSEEESFGLEQYRIGNNSVLNIFEKESIPKDIRIVFNFYKRNRV